MALGSRQTEFRTVLDELLGGLNERTATSEAYHAQLEHHLEGLESTLERITHQIKAPRTPEAADRIAQLAQQLEHLRANKHARGAPTRTNGVSLPPTPPSLVGRPDLSTYGSGPTSPATPRSGPDSASPSRTDPVSSSRSDPVAPQPTSDRVATALIYSGALLLLWLALYQVALALGLS
jgi:hypothetical protein